MKLDFSRRPKKRAVGVRLTDEEFLAIKKLAGENKSTISETASVLIRTMIKRLKVGQSH